MLAMEPFALLEQTADADYTVTYPARHSRRSLPAR
jgi:hypothetical protein